MPGGPEWIIIAVIILLLFGAKKLPELARSVGKSTREFKKGMQEGDVEQNEESPTSPTSPTPQAPVPPASSAPDST